MCASEINAYPYNGHVLGRVGGGCARVIHDFCRARAPLIIECMCSGIYADLIFAITRVFGSRDVARMGAKGIEYLRSILF